MERKLASIQTITKLEPIENADALEKAQVLGWWVVVKKGEHRVGEQVVYCEIDSLLPERPEFEFLRTSSFKAARVDGAGDVVQPAGFRIRTVRLRGQVSQGICFPLSILQTGITFHEDGDDVTEALGVSKWEQPLPPELQGKAKGPFPHFIPKTDETRVQILASVLERHCGKRFVITEKLDGTSFTAFVREGVFGVCSRNLLLDETDDNGLPAFANALDIEAQLRGAIQVFGFDIAIQGEVIGPGIQGNKYRLKAKTLYVFNVFNIERRGFVNQQGAHSILAAMGLLPVPVLATITLNHTVDELVAYSEGISTLNPGTQREGIVLRPLEEEEDPDIGGRLSFKVINPKFLLKYEE